MEDDIFELIRGLYVQWFGHEGHHFERGNGIGDIWCTSCDAVLVDPTTDWNAMGRLIAAVSARGWMVEMCYYPNGNGRAWASVSHIVSGVRIPFGDSADTLPLAVCRAVDQIPESQL